MLTREHVRPCGCLIFSERKTDDLLPPPQVAAGNDAYEDIAVTGRTKTPVRRQCEARSGHLSTSAIDSESGRETNSKFQNGGGVTALRAAKITIK